MTMRTWRDAIASICTLAAVALFFGCEGVSMPRRSSGDDASERDLPGSPRVPGTVADDGEAAASDAEDAEPEGPHVQLIGRFDTRDPAGPKSAWPGGRIIARFEGTRVSVRLNELAEAWMTGAPSEWDVAIDDVWGDRLVLKPGQADYVLARGLTQGTHTVELYKRSEAQNGTTQLMGFDFGSGALLAPPRRSARRIEIIADSVAAGFGVEGIGYPAGDCPGSDFAAGWQNFHVSLGTRFAELASAELFGTVYSGKGIARNVWREDMDTLPVVFGRALPADPTSTWDFKSWTPHVVVIMAGGNDFELGQPVDDGPASASEFTKQYRAFVSTIRERYRAAHVFLTVSPTLTDSAPAGRNARTNVLAAVKAVAEDRNGAGDKRTYWLEPAAARPSELTACNGHGNRYFHDRVAQELAAAIKPTVGW